MNSAIKEVNYADKEITIYFGIGLRHSELLLITEANIVCFLIMGIMLNRTIMGLPRKDIFVSYVI